MTLQYALLYYCLILEKRGSHCAEARKAGENSRHASPAIGVKAAEPVLSSTPEQQ
jgi:hypothetical protein